MRSIYLVAMRDYLGYVTAWGFWLGLLFTPVLLGIFMFAPSLAQSSQPTRYYSVIEQGDAFTQALRVEQRKAYASKASAAPSRAAQAAIEQQISQPYVETPAPAQSIEALKPYLSGASLIDTPAGPQRLFAVIIVPEDGGEIQYWSENVQAQGLLDLAKAADRKLAQARVFAEANVDPKIVQDTIDARRSVVQQRLGEDGDAIGGKLTTEDWAPYAVSIGMAFMLWFLIFSVINYLLMGTIEERSNKIFDSLLTSVKLPNLLAGKLLAVLALALTLMTFWGLGSSIIGYIASQNLSPDQTKDVFIVLSAILKPSLVIPAIISFVLGYLMFGSLFLALGSLCDTIQEAQTLMTPLIVLLMAPLFMLVLAMNDAQSSIIQAMVWVPLFTPFLLILRMPTEPPLWEVLAQLGLMAVTAFTILYLATRVYRAGAVHGAGVADVGRWLGKFLPGKKKPDQG